MPPKPANTIKNESAKKEDLKIEELKNSSELQKSVKEEGTKEEAPKSPRSPPNEQKSEEEPEEVNDEVSKRKRQAETFKRYIEQTGIAMAFQVVFAQILDKKIEQSKLFAYTAMRLRQIGEDLEKIKMNKK